MARKVQSERFPELNKVFRWGGYFGGGRGRYGAVDTMHFDIGGAGMAGGTWEGGLTKAQRALFPGATSAGMGPLGQYKLPELRDERLSDASPEDRGAVREDAYRSGANPFGRGRSKFRPSQPASDSLEDRVEAGVADAAWQGAGRYGGNPMGPNFHAHRLGDDMMRKAFSGPGFNATGNVNVHLSGGLEKLPARVDMDGLFKDVEISRGRQKTSGVSE